jgi:hypothetical protein
LAHFINNALGVILYYLIANGVADKKMLATGSLSNLLFVTFSSIFVFTGLYLVYRKRVNA